MRIAEHKTLSCNACGALARRGNARFCLTCGKLLSEDYQPLDNLKASYGLKNFSYPIEDSKREAFNLFQEERNSIADAAWACVVYSFMPYLGILFVPVGFILGGCGVIAFLRKPALGGKKLSILSIIVSFVVLAAQVILWYLLYLIPELQRNFD